MEIKNLINHLIQLLNFISVDTDNILLINSICLLNPIIYKALKGCPENKTQSVCLISFPCAQISVVLIGINERKELTIEPFGFRVLSWSTDVVWTTFNFLSASVDFRIPLSLEIAAFWRG